MTFVATATLFLTVAALASGVGAFVAPVLFGAFLLALVGVIASHGDRQVRQRDPAVDPCGWRGCA
ncbi:MAG TPA: hypothetical protein VK874_05625 [Gaiellaceae bacterium]|nr:hypothetical protein [Gaiellaceae bacterium]